MPLIKSLALGLFCCFALNANAAIEQIYNWNGLEFVRSGNAHHVHPASPESTKLRGGWILEISDVEPKATAKHDLPYANKGGALAKVTVTPSIDPKKVSASAATKIKEAAKAAGPNPYLAVASIACAFYCDALMDWGVDQLKKNDDGSLSAVVPDPSAISEVSDGKQYSVASGPWSLSPASACQARASVMGWSGASVVQTSPNCSIRGYRCDIGQCSLLDTFGPISYSSRSGSSCPAGAPIVNGVCNVSAPTKEMPLETYLNSRYMGKGWDHHWAKMTAAAAANDGNVFTDGTSVGITGPAIVPLSGNTTKTGVQLLPGTTTPAPFGHTGPTDSGTQTTTTTTSANNKFNPGPMTSSGSGSSGGPASGPSMTTTQTTTTTTSVTNNVTNITNITNETTTEKDEAPESATDTPLSNIPELYKQKYPDGFAGVWSSFKTNISQTSFVRLISELTPNIGSGGSCPVWTFDLGFIPGASMGVHRLGAEYCFIWPILKIILMITALFTARRLIFGG